MSVSLNSSPLAVPAAIPRSHHCSLLGRTCQFSPPHHRREILPYLETIRSIPSSTHCLSFPGNPFKQPPRFPCLSMAVDVPPASPLQESLSYCRAYWPSKYIIAWNTDVEDGSCFFLYASKAASLSVTERGVQGYDVEIKLEKDSLGLPGYVTDKFPHIKGYSAFKVPTDVDLDSLLKCQLAVAALRSDGAFKYATGLQLPGIIDELYQYDGPLGPVFSEDSVSLYLWAPTAQNVRASIYDKPSDCEPLQIVQLYENKGVWHTAGPKSWEGCYYNYEVCVYHYSTLRVEQCTANDPYARGLSSDAMRTLLVDLQSDSLKPEGWDNLGDEKPSLLSSTDASVYELHIRDFSVNDPSVPEDYLGGYLAFTAQDSACVNHLKKLSNAGLSHVHLLPSFQFADVVDEKDKWKNIDTRLLESLPPDSEEQQAQISAIKDEDPYNWGYNPVLWGVPKGSYATDPNGSCRIIEYRRMIQALNRIGLRVVLDVVYNHIFASGPNDENSVLDKIVPGYYLRRGPDGSIENSTAVNNTASKHYMVERLILDDLMSWAVNYKVDGFRFDLMGHIMKETMVKAKSKLHNLSRSCEGVDGQSIYIYGEGWDFGEIANNARGINASQMNLGGTGIGSFNDRIRDAVLGGGPFGPLLQQGFVTGLFLQPNEYDHGGPDNAARMLALSKDHIQVGMAGNLRNFVLTNSDGQQVEGSDIHTHDDAPVGYALQPSETVNYVSAHDNETLFDIVSLKTTTDISVDERCRINHLATSIVALSQGVPFFHAGDEMLRSKSLDRDSYNSGDWFNRLDFTYKTNNWGVGLPIKEKNEGNWPLMKPRLADPSYKPQRNHIVAAVDNFTTLLQIRYSSSLFRLKTAESIQERLHFHNTGPSAIPGLIVMSLEDGQEGLNSLPQLDPLYSYIVVVINARPSEVIFSSPSLQSKSLELHPALISSSDSIVKNSIYETSNGSFSVPARTTAVFVQARSS